MVNRPLLRLSRRIRYEVRKLCLLTYPTERLWQHRGLRQQYARSKGAVVVHQMSKVGSQTVVASLHEALPDHVIYHTHFISDQGLSWLEDFVRTRWGSVHIPQHLWHGQFVRDNLGRKDAPERLKIVTLVRDPVARNISEFFQELDVHLSYPYQQKLTDKGIDGVTDELESMLLHKLSKEVDWEQPYSWFDPEIRDALGMDLFTTDFDTSAGYGIFSQGNTDLLLIKLESLSECAGQAFDEFLGIKGFSLASHNVATKKYYSEAYRNIQNRLQIPADLLEACYASSHVRHFYNEKEIMSFSDRWGCKSPHRQVAEAGQDQ